MRRESRFEVLIAGLGGQGVVTMAKLLVEAAGHNYHHAFFFPSYGTEQRGGWVQCSAVLAKTLEDSQPRLRLDAAILFSSGGLSEITQRLGSGGKLFVESSLCTTGRGDARSTVDSFPGRLYLIPALEKSHELGSGQVANLIFLGAYLKATKALTLEKIEAALEEKMGEGKKASLLELNRRALRLGASLV